MKNEVIKVLKVRRGGLYVDCTFGQGGHSKAILEEGGIVIALDRDSSTFVNAEPLKRQFPTSFYWVHSSFSELRSILMDLAHPMLPDGVVFDLGFSSNQIEDGSRGFSFLHDSTLDMRYDTSKGETALDILNHLPESLLAKIFIELGEDKLGVKMARTICVARAKSRITSCFSLLSILRPFQFSSKRHFATKIFQALRIFVNDEFFHIEKGVAAALDSVKFYGRVVVITFHSLEDRIVKRCFANKNLIVPSNAEIASNPRSRSAKLRWFVKSHMEELC